jgi:hypothetical protein
MSWPAEHFPRTPEWWQAAVHEAIVRAVVNQTKWQVPLECIARYESNYGVNAHFCDIDTTLPVGVMQQSRAWLLDTKRLFPGLTWDLQGLGDPILQALMAIKYIDSELTVGGGYGGIGTIDGNVGLLPRTDRGPGDVLRLWIADPVKFSVEDARSEYRGY